MQIIASLKPYQRNFYFQQMVTNTKTHKWPTVQRLRPCRMLSPNGISMLNNPFLPKLRDHCRRRVERMEEPVAWMNENSSFQTHRTAARKFTMLMRIHTSPVQAQATSNPKMKEGRHEVAPYLRSDRQMIALGRRESVFFKSLVPVQLTMLQRKATHPHP